MKRSSIHALTLIELVVAIAVTAVLAIPLGRLLSEQLRGALGAHDSTVAMSLARHEMERLDSLNNFCHPHLNVTAPTPPPVNGYWPTYPSYALTRTVICQVPDCTSQSPGVCHNPANSRNGIKRIEVRVTRQGSPESLATLVTYRTKYVLFGS